MSIAITPDGTRVVYIGNNETQLLVRALDDLEPTAARWRQRTFEESLHLQTVNRSGTSMAPTR